jgi:hypothetical protein
MYEYYIKVSEDQGGNLDWGGYSYKDSPSPWHLEQH